MSGMSDLHIEIQEALGRGERPVDIAQRLSVTKNMVWLVLADIAE
jgi:hypothetical protein